jgi:hypothetical protein
LNPIGATQAFRILEDHCIVPRDEGKRAELFAALAWLRILALATSENP